MLSTRYRNAHTPAPTTVLYLARHTHHVRYVLVRPVSRIGHSNASGVRHCSDACHLTRVRHYVLGCAVEDCTIMSTTSAKSIVLNLTLATGTGSCGWSLDMLYVCMYIIHIWTVHVYLCLHNTILQCVYVCVHVGEYVVVCVCGGGGGRERERGGGGGLESSLSSEAMQVLCLVCGVELRTVIGRKP